MSRCQTFFSTSSISPFLPLLQSRVVKFFESLIMNVSGYSNNLFKKKNSLHFDEVYSREHKHETGLDVNSLPESWYMVILNGNSYYCITSSPFLNFEFLQHDLYAFISSLSLSIKSMLKCTHNKYYLFIDEYLHVVLLNFETQLYYLLLCSEIFSLLTLQY